MITKYLVYDVRQQTTCFSSLQLTGFTEILHFIDKQYYRYLYDPINSDIHRGTRTAVTDICYRRENKITVQSITTAHHA